MRTVPAVMVLLAVILFFRAGVGGAEPMKATRTLSEENQVRHAVESLYVEGLITRDFALIRTICVPEAKLMSATDCGTLNVTTLDRWSARFDQANPSFQTIDCNLNGGICRPLQITESNTAEGPGLITVFRG